ncbi:MAG: V-type ATPase subunit [Clostridia bacterium]|nr:V-type ATPase subunit [Clostridia bacterium]
MADYLFGSANVRTLESAIIGRERIARLMETKNADEAYALLAEYGVQLYRYEDSGAMAREETLLGILRGAYQRVTELAPDSGALALWLYPYDCNNLKAAIKGAARGIEPYSMMFDFGTVPTEDVVQAVATGVFDAFPRAMRASAEEAVATFAKTNNPQVVDLILDRACYKDMLEAARASENDYVLRIVTAKIDLTNLMILLRILRMKSGEAGRALLEESLLTGGKLSHDALMACYAAGEESLWETLKGSDYRAFAEQLYVSDKSLSVAERIADNAVMKIVSEAKFIPMGLEVMVAFLLAHEYEVRNLRIVLSGKEAGVDTATIRERIRDSYV